MARNRNKCNNNQNRNGRRDAVRYDRNSTAQTSSKTEDGSKNESFPSGRSKVGFNYPSTTDNDVSWYALNKEMLDQSARLNMSNRAGDPITFSGKAQLSSNCSIIPGIVRFDYIPALGRTSMSPKSSGTYAYIANSVMKDAGTNIYSYVRSHNSGAINYEWQDMIAIIYAGSQIFAAIAHAIRIYGIAKTNYQNNTYVPDEVLRSMDIDPKSFRDNLANYLFKLNYLIQKASVIWVPSDFPLTKREYWMNTNLYYDADSTKAGIIYYYPAFFYKYSPKTSTSGSELVPIYKYKNANDNGMKLLTTIEEMLNAVLDDSDAGTIFGDLYKAYGASSLYSVGEISPDYSIAPSYNEEVNQQFHGLTIIPTTNYPHIVQDVDKSQFVQDCFTVGKESWVGSFSDVVLDLYGKDASPERVMIATRMTSMIGNVTKSTSGDLFYLEVISGTEICIAAHVFTRKPTGGVEDMNFYTFQVATHDQTINRISRTDKFDWMPLMYLTTSRTDPSQAIEITHIIGDLENYTHLGIQTLEKMHTTALLSEFGVPIKLV